MNRNKHLPLTETVFYILLALTQPAHGYVIMQKVEELSNGEVRIAAGTLYGAIENLLKLQFIVPVQSSDARRKTYVITQHGMDILQMELQRMRNMLIVSDQVLQLGGEGYAQV